MISLLISIAITTAYLAVGFWFGPKDVPRHLDAMADRWPGLYDPYHFDRVYPHLDNSKERRKAFKSRTRSAASWLFVCAFFWPIIAVSAWVIPQLLAEGQSLDPLAQELRIKEQQERIADLERELGIEELQ